jgi:hypothetical protein
MDFARTVTSGSTPFAGTTGISAVGALSASGVTIG